MFFLRKMLTKSVAGCVYPKMDQKEAYGIVRASINYAIKKGVFKAQGSGEGTTIKLVEFLRWAKEQKNWSILKEVVKYPTDYPKIEISGEVKSHHTSVQASGYVGGAPYKVIEKNLIEMLTENFQLKRQVENLRNECDRLQGKNTVLQKDNSLLMTQYQKRKADGGKPPA